LKRSPLKNSNEEKEDDFETLDSTKDPEGFRESYILEKVVGKGTMMGSNKK
jgi:hypothetical protein